MRRILRGTDLRYTLTRLIQVLGPMTVSDLCAQLETLNFGVEGRPTKVVSDALRWEMGRDRVIRRGRGLYGEGWAPTGTAYRIVDRVESLKVEAESPRGGKTATRSFDRVSDNPFNPALWTPVGDLDAHFADLTDITYHRHVIDGVLQPTVRVAFDRPEVRNAFNETAIAEIAHAFRAMDQDRQVRVIVLAARGPAFCAGADLNWMKKMASYTDAENLADAAALADMLQAIYACSKPTVARVQGDCYAGGMGLVAACDMAVAQESAGFCLSEVRLGLIPATISPYVIRAIGERAARRYFLTAERFDAAQAKATGLVHELATEDKLDHAVDILVQSLLTCSPHAQQEAKRLINDIAGEAIEPHLIADTVRRIAEIRASADGREGVQAFLNKRKPSWLTDIAHDS